ncbi:pilus assembly protein PilM [Providencia stuartii]
MYSQKWNIGIDLCQASIQLVATKQNRKRRYLCECWQHNIPNEITSQSEHDRYEMLLKILIQWRRKLPKNCQVSMAFSALRTLKQQVTLPEQVTLKQPELGWYLQSCAEKLFPLSSEDLVIDYRVIDNRAYLNGVRKSEIVFWQNLLHDSGFLLTAIDVAPCVLRYIARYAGLPDESWLIHYRQGEWLWTGPVSQPATYNQIQENDITTLPQIIALLNENNGPLKLPLYYIGDHHKSQAVHSWSVLQAFHNHTVRLPHQLGDFVVATGLALRDKDRDHVSS